MNSRAIRDFAANHSLTLRALHADGVPTERPLADDDVGFSIHRGEGRDQEDLGWIWQEEGQFVLESRFGDVRDPSAIVLLDSLL